MVECNEERRETNIGNQLPKQPKQLSTRKLTRMHTYAHIQLIPSKIEVHRALELWRLLLEHGPVLESGA
jgi:hypothetical protein